MDFKWYDYTLRPIRTSSFALALMYSAMYWFNAFLAIDLIYIQDNWNNSDSQALPDFMLASMSSYAAVHFAFTEFF